ncbi:hypothetical protein GGD81_003912 [Rhodobium orientis]|nr:hypothetical protein [Rhodobium orientis]
MLRRSIGVRGSGTDARAASGRIAGPMAPRALRAV